MEFSIDEIKKTVSKITGDTKLMELFQKDPVKAVEGAIGVDLPDDIIKKVIDAVKAKIASEKVAGGIDAIKKLF